MQKYRDTTPMNTEIYCPTGGNRSARLRFLDGGLQPLQPLVAPGLLAQAARYPGAGWRGDNEQLPAQTWLFFAKLGRGRNVFACFYGDCSAAGDTAPEAPIFR